MVIYMTDPQDEEHSLANYIFDQFVVAEPSSTLAEIKSWLQAKGGKLDWVLLVREEDGTFQGAPFERIWGWQVQRQRRISTLQELLQDPESPLAAVPVVEEDKLALSIARDLASEQADGILAVTWAGQVVGIFKEAERSTALDHGMISGQKPDAEIIPGAAVYAEFDDSSINLPVIGPVIPPRLLHWPVVRLKGFYQQYRLGVIAALIWFIITFFYQFVLPTMSINLSEIAPNLFPPLMTGEWNVVVAGFTPV